MAHPSASSGGFPIRADLHCHTNASSEAGEALLNAISCPESFSKPVEVYAQAKRRGMDFVTITDHDSLAGVRSLAPTPDLIVGEELTCSFPEDDCKMHVLVWGITLAQHDALQAVAKDIYRVAQYIESEQIAHAVAHPVYRQNDRLERWHLERLILLFKGFECLNGAHSILHREAFEPMVLGLTPERISELSARHELEPLWPEPWVKSRTGGSDDHGLFNIGRTWTQFPADATTADRILDCLRQGRCEPGGEAGSSLKLAHNFYSVGIHYCRSRMTGNPTPSMRVLEAMVGSRPLRKRDVVRAAVKNSVGAVGRRLRRKPAEPSGTELLNTLFRGSIRNRITSHAPLLSALKNGEAPLAQHEAIFKLLCEVTRDTTAGTAESVLRGIGQGRIGPMFDSLSAIACQQFMLLPYYFALFHQNRERQLLPRLTGAAPRLNRENLKLGIFSDTYDEMNGVSRFVAMLGRQAQINSNHLTIHTCDANPVNSSPARKNFTPLVSCPFPAYPQQSLSIPPVAEILEWADRQQFDAIHVHTPGPMGLCGLLVASMLRVPVLGTYHTDFPAYVRDHTGDHRLTVAAESYMRWFFGQADKVFSRSREFERSVASLGINVDRIATLPPCVDTETFSPAHRDPNFWHDARIGGSAHLLYSGRISAEKNLGVLADAFRLIVRSRPDATLVIAGDGPQMNWLRERLTGLPVHFAGRLGDARLSSFYANSDLLLFPSTTETLGQVVLEAQASGLPALVSNVGGPKEIIDDGLTGRVLPPGDVTAWANAALELLADEPRRLRMSRTAAVRMARCGPTRTFDAYWDAHVAAALAAQKRHATEVAIPTSKLAPSMAEALS
jgi:glycosyltransferase involved in cell wall biosynthesis